ncbi:MAG: Uma2 family endonuclease, partial [Planctomycetota bacterium]
LDLERRELTVFRKPVEAADSPFGWRYALTEVVAEAGEVSALATPGATLRVADMLPPVPPKS